MVQIRVFVYFRQIPFLKRKRCYHRVDHRRPPRVGIIHPPKRETISLGHYHHFIDYTDNRCRLIKKGNDNFMSIEWPQFLKEKVYIHWEYNTFSDAFAQDPVGFTPDYILGPSFLFLQSLTTSFFWSSLTSQIQCVTMFAFGASDPPLRFSFRLVIALNYILHWKANSVCDGNFKWNWETWDKWWLRRCITVGHSCLTMTK